MGVDGGALIMGAHPVDRVRLSAISHWIADIEGGRVLVYIGVPG